jgi:hypothetical protein
MNWSEEYGGWSARSRCIFKQGIARKVRCAYTDQPGSVDDRLRLRNASCGNRDFLKAGRDLRALNRAGGADRDPRHFDGLRAIDGVVQSFGIRVVMMAGAGCFVGRGSRVPHAAVAYAALFAAFHPACDRFRQRQPHRSSNPAREEQQHRAESAEVELVFSQEAQHGFTGYGENIFGWKVYSVLSELAIGNSKKHV